MTNNHTDLKHALMIIEKMDIFLGMQVGQLKEVNSDRSEYASIMREQLNMLKTIHGVK
jgi:hypothetical protein